MGARSRRVRRQSARPAGATAPTQNPPRTLRTTRSLRGVRTVHRLATLGLSIAMLGVLAWWLLVGRQKPHPGAVAAAGQASASGAAGTSLGAVAGPPTPALSADAAGKTSPASDERAQRQQRLARAEETLASYVRATRYPPGSHPARDHADQLFPQAPVVRGLPLVSNRGAGHTSQDVQLKLRQDRLHLVGEDSVRLGVRCEDSLGQALPCAITATARELERPAGSTARQRDPLPLDFTDDGRNGDEAAHDGWLTTTFQPSQQGFRGFFGPLRIDLDVRSGSEPGQAFFDLLYTPEAPATLTGRVREVVEDGSLSLYVGLTVRTAGRYLIHARVDDAQGKPLAFLEWNDPLSTGQKEAKLVLFGKLLLDEKPAWPLKVRDVDGFLLREDAFPDRMHLSPLLGAVHTTQVYPASSFSDAEWQSEERTRHRDHFEAEVKEAKAELDKLPP